MDKGVVELKAGDLNAHEQSAVHRSLVVDGLRDVWDEAEERVTPQWGTYSGYRRRRVGGRRIDHILVDDGVEVLEAGINATRFDGKAPSDHEPVQAVLRHRRTEAGSTAAEGNR